MGIFFNRQLTDISWAAVCHGAAINGLVKDVVVNYVSRYNYGVVFSANPANQSYEKPDREIDTVYGSRMLGAVYSGFC